MTDYEPRARLLTTAEAAQVAHVEPATVRQWVHRGHLHAYVRTVADGSLFLESDVLEAERAARNRRRPRTSEQQQEEP